MAARDLEERLLEYAARVVRVVQALPKNATGKHFGDQLLRSATSAGANYMEAQSAESKADFIHKLQLSLKELREARYWLRLVARAGLVPLNRLVGLLDESDQLLAILSKSVASAKGKAKS